MRLRIFLIILFFTTAAAPIHAGDGAFQNGEIFVGLAGGRITVFNGSRLRTTLHSPSGGEQTGMCFDIDGNLYTTDFYKSSMSKFDKNGRIVTKRWGGPFSVNPESCVVDGKGNVYTGEVYGQNRIRKFTSSGKLIDSYQPKVDGKGVDWIDLAADQCTMFYTSESSKVMRYDVCRKKQLPDFTNRLQGPCFAMRLRENGEVMVACKTRVYRLSPSGSEVRTYPIANETLFAMNLDPDGRHFWTGGITSGNVYKVDINSGQGTKKALFNGGGSRPRDTTTLTGVLQNVFDQVSIGGLTVYGERTAAITAAVRKKEEEQKRALQREADRLAEQRRKKDEDQKRLAKQQRDREEADRRRIAEAQRKLDEAEKKRRDEQERLRLQEERKRQEEEARIRRAAEEKRRLEEEARRRRAGRVAFGPPRPVDFGVLSAGEEKAQQLDLTGTEVEGYGQARLTTTLPTSGLALEIKTESGWKKLGSDPFALALDPSGPRDWPLRLRVGRCAPCVDEGESHEILLATKAEDGQSTTLRIALAVLVRESSWLECWWPALAVSVASMLGLFLVYGLISPSRFAQRVGLVLSPEEDMSEGHFHGVRGQPGSRSGFYRDARVYLTPDYRVSGRAAGAIARLRADRQQVRIQPMAGATVWRLSADDEWQALGPEEVRMHFGTVYRDDMKSVFFELRNA